MRQSDTQINAAWQEFQEREAEVQRRRDAGLCARCGKRPGRIEWGDALSFTHGGGEMRCGVCVYGAQLWHALGRAAHIPILLGWWIAAWAQQR